MTATDAPPVAAVPEGTGRRARVLSALAPAGVFLAARLLGVLTLLWLSALRGGSGVSELWSWDGQWLLAIAGNGYGGVPGDMVDAFGNHTPTTSLGFFPGYPAAVSAVGLLTGGNMIVAGLLVSLVAGIGAAYGLARLGEIVPGGSRRAGLALAGLFAATPMAITLNMAYTEALFCAFAVWSLVGVLRRQWLLAGAFCGLAGLVRPTANALVLAVVLAALVTILRRRDGIRPWAGALLAVSGLGGYLGYVAVRTGSLTGWFEIQRTGWGWYVDGGGATIGYLHAVLTGGQNVYDGVAVLVLVGALGLLWLGMHMRLPWPLLVYGAGVVATVWLSAGLMNTKIRLLIPAFVLLLPIALGLAKRRPATAVAAVAVAALISAWFGGYALTIWQYAI